MTSTFTSRALTALAAASVTIVGIPDMTAAAKPSGVTKACFVTPTSIDCYPTEAALYTAHPELDGTTTARLDPAIAAAAATCSTSVKLYTGSGHTGTLYTFTARQSWISLPTGINNATSSFKIGACAATFKDTAGGTSTYPGSTVAGASATSMSTGWDNRISAIYIA
jgi:hypothetical protein